MNLNKSRIGMETRMISDKAHRELMSKYICFLKEMSDAKGCDNAQLAVEKPYNYYGQRGFIDILFSEGTAEYGRNVIVEIKPKLDNLGEAIRQLNRAEECILKNVITDFNFVDAKLFKFLVCLSTEENYNIIEKSMPIHLEALFWKYSACKHGLKHMEIYREMKKYWPNFNEFLKGKL